MRVASVASAVVLVVLALVVLIRAGLLLPGWYSLSQKVIWVVVAYCGIAVLAHIFTPSKWERIVWLPVVVILFITGLLVCQFDESISARVVWDRRISGNTSASYEAWWREQEENGTAVLFGPPLLGVIAVKNSV
jgi:hypothetical protein